MTDQQEAQQAPEAEAPAEAMPTSEQKASEPVETTEVAEREAEVVETDQELPKDAKERTREQFEKLKADLADERERRLRLERAFSLNKPNQPEDGKVPEWYDPETGTVDTVKLSQREAQLQNKVDMLETRLSGITRKEEEMQEKEAYEAYPELNPKSGNFDEDFQKQLISYMATEFAEGRQPSMKQAADKIIAIAEKRAKKAEKEGAAKALESLSPKEQAALEATGRSDRRVSSEDYASIRNRTRQGGRAGLEEAMRRISKIPPVGT